MRIFGGRGVAGDGATTITPVALETLAVSNRKLSYCWDTARRESMPKIAEMDVEMTT